jgi:hypothetical protein
MRKYKNFEHLKNCNPNFGRWGQEDTIQVEVNGVEYLLTCTAMWGKKLDTNVFYDVDQSQFYEYDGLSGFWACTTLEGYIAICTPVESKNTYLVYAPEGRYVSNFVGEEMKKPTTRRIIIKGYPLNLIKERVVCCGFTTYARAKWFAENCNETPG